MENFNSEIFEAFQNKLKVGNRRGVHLNAIPGNSRYKFDLARLSAIFKSLPERFILDLLTLKNMNFNFSIHDNSSSESNRAFKNATSEVFDTNLLKEKSTENLDTDITKISVSFDNLIFQNDVIKSEKGINTLGFGFPILVRKDMNDGQITVSPILIWSLNIKQTSQMNTWEISRAEDDPIYLNEVLINHLQNDSGITLNSIPTEMLEDGKIDKMELLEICQDILNQLKVTQNLDFLLNNYEPIFPVKTKLAYDKLLPNRGDAFIEKAGIFSLFEVQKQNIINDYQLLKTAFKAKEADEISDYQSLTSVETDPSQQGVLEALKTQDKILIQGPPGTGKSQTLTAVLINALQNKQKTIVVCEKQTALEVLYNALHARGHGKFCMMIKDSSTDRRLVVDAVRNTIDATDFKNTINAFPDNVIKDQVESITQNIFNINNIHKVLNTTIIADLNFTQIVAKILEFEDIKQPLSLANISFNFTDLEYDEVVKLLESENLYALYKPFESNFIFNTTKLISNNPFVIQNEISDAINYYLKEWNEIQQLITNYESNYYFKRKEVFGFKINQIQDLINQTEVLTSTLNNSSDVFDTKKTNGFFYKFLANFSSNKKQAIATQNKLLDISQQLKKLTLEAKLSVLEISGDLWQNKNNISNYRKVIENDKANFTLKAAEDFKNLDYLNFIDSEIETNESLHITNKLKQLKYKITADNWFSNSNLGNTYGELSLLLNQNFAIYNSYEKNNSLLNAYNWFKLKDTLTTFQLQCFSVLTNITNWTASFLYAYFKLLLIKNSSDDLNFNEQNYTEYVSKLKSFSVSQNNFIDNYWSVARQLAVKNFEKNNTDITVANLYNKRKSTNHNRLPLRQIAIKDIDLFTSFFPILFTTPDVCSNLFQGKNFYFDNVIFDEASQLKLEDNLPAILKGKKVIIAGDEHQMPPSNYFSRVFEGNIEDEDDLEDDENVITHKSAILNIESLLDFALEYKFDKNHLDFHYRSKHPYLIDFSNHAFYNSRLKPLPSTSSIKPIEFFEIDGTFNEHINDEEAQKVIEILETLQPKPNGQYPSVGIATFNITQRNYIRRKIIEKQLSPENLLFSNKINELDKAGLFIKNLENIQGDERDIIILSCTYGKKPEGKFVQSFGPINHSKGYKLLNVIITRAKEKIYVCNSVPPVFYENYKSALSQEGANNRKAVFYAYLAYCKAVSEQNEEKRIEILNELDKYALANSNTQNQKKNNFKNQIYKQLKAKYPNAKLTLNYYFGGYNIDILLEIENQKPIAIECLSNENYQTDLAYLEDFHKEKTLKNAGFDYKRIWSQNCWQQLNFDL